MTFEWLVALRYLRSPNRPAVLRLVTLLAVVGVAAGVTTLVIALSMNTGFRQAIRDRLLSVTAHVNLKPLGPDGIRDYRDRIAQLSSVAGVRSIEPAIYNTVLLSSGGRAAGVEQAGLHHQDERPLARRGPGQRALGGRDFIERPAHVNRASARAFGGLPGDGRAQGPIDLENAGAVTVCLQLTAEAVR